MAPGLRGGASPCAAVTNVPKTLQRKGKEFWLFSRPHLPSVVTVMALCSSLASIYHAIQATETGDLAYSISCIWLAGLLDMLDGRLARYLNACSEFGAEMDSLADLISFGVCPSVCIYLTQIRPRSDYGFAGFCPLLLYCSCMAIRLARFNVTHTGDDVPEWATKFFSGVPAPAGSFLLMAPYYFEKADLIEEVPTWYWCFHTVMIGGFLVSNIRTFSNKAGQIRRRAVMSYLMIFGMGILGYGIFLQPIVWLKVWTWLALVIVGYVLSWPISHMQYLEMKRDWLAAHPKAS